MNSRIVRSKLIYFIKCRVLRELPHSPVSVFFFICHMNIFPLFFFGDCRRSNHQEHSQFLYRSTFSCLVRADSAIVCHVDGRFVRNHEYIQLVMWWEMKMVAWVRYGVQLRLHHQTATHICCSTGWKCIRWEHVWVLL